MFCAYMLFASCLSRNIRSVLLFTLQRPFVFSLHLGLLMYVLWENYQGPWTQNFSKSLTFFYILKLTEPQKSRQLKFLCQPYATAKFAILALNLPTTLCSTKKCWAAIQAWSITFLNRYLSLKWQQFVPCRDLERQNLLKSNQHISSLLITH